jgi:protein-serine/threonine kinase
MLHPNPEKRATMQEVLTDRWMKTIECCCPEPEDLERCVTCIDAAGKGSGKLAAKMIVQKKHHHIPADKRRRFDMDET